MTIIALYNLKGGVGKTTAAINLAYLSAKEKTNTLLWDLDPQGSASFYLGVDASIKNESKKLLKNNIELDDSIQPSAYPHLYVIPADLSARQADILLSEGKQSKKRLANLLAPLKKQFKTIIIDSPPGISLLQENIFQAADWVFMPNIPSTLSVRSFETVISYVQQAGFNVDAFKGFFNMVDNRKNLHQQTINFFAHNPHFLKQHIPYLSDVEKMGINESPLETFAANSQAAQCFRDLWLEIKKIVHG